MHLKIGGGQIGARVRSRADAQRLLEKGNGLDILALQNANTAEIGVARETVRGERDDVREHGDRFFIARMIHIEKTEPVVGGPVAGTKSNSLLESLFGIGGTAEALVSTSETAIRIVTCRLEFECSAVLISGFLVFTTRDEGAAQTGVGCGKSRTLHGRLLASFDGCVGPALVVG